MKITIKCDCGNEVIIPTPAGKYTQFRDYLATKQFRLGVIEVKSGVLNELKIECDNCKQSITLGVD